MATRVKRGYQIGKGANPAKPGTPSALLYQFQQEVKMLIKRTQLAGLAMMAGVTLAAATACQKKHVNPLKVKTGSQLVIDTAGTGDKTQNQGQNPQLRVMDGTPLSGEEEKPKLPPH